MTEYRYSFSSLLPDWARGLAGLLVGLTLTIFTVRSSLLFYIALALTLLFAAYLLRTAVRQGTALAVDGEGVAARRSLLGGTWRTRIGWGDMRGVTLRYFSTRRDRSEGWMEIRVAGPGRPITADSALEGFPRLVTAITDAARERALPLDPATLANLDTLLNAGRRGEVRGETI